MRRIGRNRQMRQFVHDGNGGNIERIASVGLESAYTALAGDDVVIASRHDVLGGKQEFLDGRGDAALEKDRLLQLAELAQQIEVLHVARADLQDVDVRHHLLDLRNLHDLADHQQIELVSGFTEQFESLEPKALK